MINVTRQRRQKAIYKRTDELVAICGISIDGRARIVLALMSEFGISDQSAIQHFSLARKRTKGVMTNESG